MVTSTPGSRSTRFDEFGDYHVAVDASPPVALDEETDQLGGRGAASASLFGFRDGRVVRAGARHCASIIDAIDAIPISCGAWRRPVKEAVSTRLAEIREGLTLLADYL